VEGWRSYLFAGLEIVGWPTGWNWRLCQSPISANGLPPVRRRIARLRRNSMAGGRQPALGISNFLPSRRSIVAVTIILAICLGGGLLIDALSSTGMRFSLDYLRNIAGIELSQGETLVFVRGWPTWRNFSASDTNAQALIAGLLNTLTVSLMAIGIATVLGFLAGLGRFSTNWLIRTLLFLGIEVTRNTPLMIQIMFWYFGVILMLPPISGASGLFGDIFVGLQGIYLPRIVTLVPGTDGLLLVLFAFVLLILYATSARPGRRQRPLLWLAVAAFVLSIIPRIPFAIDHPEATRFGALGGLIIRPEFSALLLAISVNSAAYIAEIVRGAINAIPTVQWEAATALGLTRCQILREIILPQVLRIALPALGNQYVSLAKNTSLGIAIGFSDLFSVAGTIVNQTARTLETFLILMASYVLLSFAISAVVNLANSRLQNVEGTR
jgi:general L-amino acid transport system permease protein